MKKVAEQNSNASESTFHVVGDVFWLSNPKICYSLVNGRPWQAGDPPYDYCRRDADGVTFCYRESAA